MAIRMKNSLLLMVNARSDYCAPLKAFGGKEEIGKAPENGKTNRPDTGFRAFGNVAVDLLPIFFAVTKPNGSLVDASNPASANEVLVIFCAGLGEVNPPVVAGAAAVLSMTVNPVTVTMGSQPASVDFAGLAPGFAGLYQVNARVPGGLTPANDVPLQVSVAGQQSTPVTIAVR